MSLRQLVLEKSFKEKKNFKQGISLEEAHKMAEEKENIEITNQAQETTTKEKKRKENFSELCKEDLVDRLHEYSYKYEQLKFILKQLEENLVKMVEENLQLHQGLLDSKKENTAHLFTLESTKYQLEQEKQLMVSKEENFIKERDKLLKIVHDLEKETKNYVTDLDKTPLHDKQEFIEKLEKSMHCVASTPNLKSRRSKRKSMLSQTMALANNDAMEKIEIYEDVIVDQQEILDFYSLLTGISISKSKNTKNQNETEDNPTEEWFSCRLQLNNSLNGYEFNMAFDPSRREIDFKRNLGNLESELPVCLKSSRSFDVDLAYLFLRDILTGM